MQYWYLLLVFAAGIGSPIQASMNSKLRESFGDTTLAAGVSFVVGFALLLAFWIGRGAVLPTWGAMREGPWWMWLSGAIGAYFVVATLLSADKLGAALLVAVLVGGQVCAGLVLDHFGLLGYEVRPLNLWRIAGAALVVGGVVLIQRF